MTIFHINRLFKWRNGNVLNFENDIDKKRIYLKFNRRVVDHGGERVHCAGEVELCDSRSRTFSRAGG